MANMVAPPIIEATSLQTVTQLAANPPQDPTERVPPNTPALVLYIARVPGSRDVFLTPIKPRDKVVTAEDVQSSLYYLHINGPEDYHETDEPGPPVQHVQKPTSVNTDSANLPPMPPRPVSKKAPPPLPKRRGPQPAVSTLPYPIDDGAMPNIVERPPSPPPHQYLPGDRNDVIRKPLQTNNSNVPYPTNSSGVEFPPLPARRKLPTPPSEEHDQATNSLHAENIRLLRQSSIETTHDNPYTRSYSSHPETLKQLDLDSRPEAGTLTLIRRDPGSGEQWNVASILDPAVEEVSSSSLLVPTANRRTKKGGRPVYLDITNAAYARFSRPTISRAGSNMSASSSTSSTEDEPLNPEGVFRRRLYMPGSRFSDHNSTTTHRKHSSLSTASGSTFASDQFTLRSDRHHSVDIASLHSTPPNPNADKRTKGYTFLSPWNGPCEFSTGTAGRSLKCRHHLPTTNFVSEVSELRFNLPTSSRAPVLAAKKSSHFLHRRQDSFEAASDAPGIELDENGRLRLELGRERAGGGFGGKRAKLGKLVVWPEGVKMLDLLVAANLGLWWRAWERSGGG